MAPEIQGDVAPGFEPVRDAFARLFAEGVESGASVAAIVEGRVVVELWGGTVGREGLVHVYSVTKPFAAACALWLVDHGAVGLDARVTEVWPEYGQGGKESTTLRHLLSHQAGVLGWREPQPLEALLDLRRAAELLAAEPAWWPPGTAHGEHALFYGTLLGEIVRRVDGRSLGSLFRDEFARPWGLDVHIGLAPEEEARVVALTDEDSLWPGGLLEGKDEDYRLALDNPPALAHLDVVNSPAWRRAEVPAVNAHAGATGVARFYAGLLGGGELESVRVLGERTVAEMTSPQASGPDRLLGEDVTWGLGVGLDDAGWGMGGIGGSLGWADPARGLAWSYLTTRMGDHERAIRLEASLLAAIDRPTAASG